MRVSRQKVAKPCGRTLASELPNAVMTWFMAISDIVLKEHIPRATLAAEAS